MRIQKPLFITLFIAMAAPAANTAAKDITDDLKSPLSGLYVCAEVNDEGKRLACFDEMVASLKVAEEKKEIVAIDAQSAKKIKREAFGFNIPSLPKLGLPKIGGDEKIDSVVMKVTSIKKQGRRYVIRFENGQIWEEVGGYINYIPRGELTATIKPKSMGSYMLSLHKGKTTVRGLRIRRIE